MEKKTITIFCTFARTFMDFQLPDENRRERRPCNDGSCQNYACQMNENGPRREESEEKKHQDRGMSR